MSFLTAGRSHQCGLDASDFELESVALGSYFDLIRVKQLLIRL